MGICYFKNVRVLIGNSARFNREGMRGAETCRRGLPCLEGDRVFFYFSLKSSKRGGQGGDLLGLP